MWHTTFLDFSETACQQSTIQKLNQVKLNHRQLLKCLQKAEIHAGCFIRHQTANDVDPKQHTEEQKATAKSFIFTTADKPQKSETTQEP